MNGRTTKARSFLSSPVATEALILASLAALLTLLAVSSCGKANPVAPTGSTLSLRVNPTTISSPRGSATATATLIRPNGTPDNGAQVQFTTTLGTFNPAVATTKTDGNATSTLTGGGLIGTAKVTAFSGNVMSTEVDVMIGQPEALITLQATPSTITIMGQGSQDIQLLALVRDAQGNPVPSSPVSFSAQAGTLRSHGNFVFTDSTGAAHDVLTVTSTDLTNQTGSSFNINVQGSTGTAVTFAENIARAPVASFTATVITGNLSVSFTDTSTNHPTSWFWTFGNPGSGSANTSSEQNPAHTFTRAGSFVVTLTATNAVGSGSSSQVITVTSQ
jgi:PKD repeat protein